MLEIAKSCVSNSSKYEYPMPFVQNDYIPKDTGDKAIDFAMTVFEDPLVALRWLNTTNVEFDGKKPVDLIKSHKGELRVLETLTRIKENVYH